MTRSSNKQLTCREMEQWLIDRPFMAHTEPTCGPGPELAHLEQCDSCRTEGAVLEVLGLDGTSGPARPLDDLSRKRLVSVILAGAEQGKARAAHRRLSRSKAGLGAWRLAVALTMSAAALLAVAGALLVQGPTAGPAPGPGDQGANRSRGSARVLLSSGTLRVQGAGAEAAQPVAGPATLRAGQTLRTAKQGSLVLGLAAGSRLFLGPRSTLDLRRLDSHRVLLGLGSGQLVAAVARRGPGQVFCVQTPSGLITVKGTVFAVRARPERIDVKVLRGRVWVRVPGQAAKELWPGQVLGLGDPDADHEPARDADPGPSAGSGPAVLPSGSRGTTGQDLVSWLEQVQEQARLLDLLPDAAEGGAGDLAWLRIQSAPAGAEVTLDRLRVGHTPLVVAVLAGSHELLVQGPHGTRAREQVRLEPGQVLSRSFDLTKGPGPGPGPPAPRATSMTRASAPRHRPQTPQQILARARGHRMQRAWTAAARAYRLLIRQHPDSQEALAAQVSLGTLALGPLADAALALHAFEAYLALAPAGDLGPEAAFGRARALRQLGRSQQEAQALRHFLLHHRSAPQAGAARRRLKELGIQP